MLTVVRVVMSMFAALLVIVAVMGWFWTRQHQVPTQAIASHIVLAASALAGLTGLFSIWHGPSAFTPRPAKSGDAQ
jgi:hypothetical protein